VARYGGEEFVILARTGRTEALRLADRIRESIAEPGHPIADHLDQG
jgi:GGDEF domain-containing protein